MLKLLEDHFLNFAAAISCFYISIRAFVFAPVEGSAVILGIAFLFLAFVLGFGVPTKNQQVKFFTPLAFIGFAVLTFGLGL